MRATREPSKPKLGEFSQATSTSLPNKVAAVKPAKMTNTSALIPRNTRSKRVILLPPRGGHLLFFYLFSLVFLLLLRKLDTQNVQINFHHIKAGHNLDGALHVLLDLPGDFGNAVTILDDHKEVDHAFVGPNIHLDALGQIAVPQHFRDSSGNPATHTGDARYFSGSQPGNDPHYFVGNLQIAQFSAAFVF